VNTHCRFIPLLIFFSATAWGQNPQTAGEVSSQEEQVTFQSRVNLVLVPVVVRDKTGKVVGNLRQQDFQLTDKGKPQIISRFSVETSGGRRIPKAPQVETASGEKTDDPGILAADHFVALLFDDIHLSFSDLVPVREAAGKYVSSTLKATDRVAIFSTSGQTTQDFTDDRELLQRALSKLAPRPVTRSAVQECPDISFFMADLIVNKNDQQALGAAAREALVCMNLPDMKSAESLAESSAHRVLNAGEHETRVTLLSLKDIVRRMALMPGQRAIVLSSPGFLTVLDQRSDEGAVIDQAIRSSVTISALDARGLYTAMPDISKHTINLAAEQVKQQIDRQAASAEADILAELAQGTGGRFVQNTNDLAGGIRELSAAPEAFYILGFSPQNLKLDGGYHALKAIVKLPAGLNVTGRRGYYAPKHLSSADEDAKEEITQALFSRDEVREIPVEMHTQFFKSSDTEARLSVISRLDVRKLKYRKADGRNVNEVKIVSALFDRNGNYLQSVSKLLSMRLLDGTLENKLASGLSIRSDFKISPGTYVIRVVVRDAEGQMMAAQNGAVEIP